MTDKKDTTPPPAAGEHDKNTLEGAVPQLASDAERNAAMDDAFDYRGDVTITTRDGKTIEGYVFDRRGKAPEPYVRLIPKDSDDRINIRYSDIAKLAFSGRDTAAGKSWENWLKRYIEKKSAGEHASIESEPLE
jgi:hypothetical protein